MITNTLKTQTNTQICVNWKIWTITKKIVKKHKNRMTFCCFFLTQTIIRSFWPLSFQRMKIKNETSMGHWDCPAHTHTKPIWFLFCFVRLFFFEHKIPFTQIFVNQIELEKNRIFHNHLSIILKYLFVYCCCSNIAKLFFSIITLMMMMMIKMNENDDGQRK